MKGLSAEGCNIALRVSVLDGSWFVMLIFLANVIKSWYSDSTSHVFPIKANYIFKIILL